MKVNKSVVGVDIGSNSVRVVSLIGSGVGKVYAFAEVEIPKDVFTPHSIKDKDKVAISLKKALDNTEPRRIAPHFACTALPESEVFTKVITLPKMSKKEFDRVINDEITQILPRPLEELEVDQQILGFKENQMDVLVVAADKNLVSDICEVFDTSGLNLIRLETKPAALGRIIVGKKTNPLILVDIGAKSSSISVYDFGQIRMTATTPVGGDVWKKVFANNDTDSKALYQAKDFISTISVITDEVESAINYYQTRTNTANVITEIYLAGGGSELSGIAEVFSETLKIPTSVVKPDIKFQAGMDNHYLVACGAALDPPI